MKLLQTLLFLKDSGIWFFKNLFQKDFRLTELHKYYRKSLYILHPVPTNVNILHNPSSVIKTKKLTLVQHY